MQFTFPIQKSMYFSIPLQYVPYPQCVTEMRRGRVRTISSVAACYETRPCHLSLVSCNEWRVPLQLLKKPCFCSICIEWWSNFYQNFLDKFGGAWYSCRFPWVMLLNSHSQVPCRITYIGFVTRSTFILINYIWLATQLGLGFQCRSHRFHFP